MSDPLGELMSLKWRILLGLAVLATLAFIDWRKHGRESKRIKEYGFILAVMLGANLYGVLHDVVTSSISPEYFINGKGLKPSKWFPLEVAWLAIKGTYGIGLLVGVTLILANNPSANKPQLTYKDLFKALTWPISLAVVCALFGAGTGNLDVFDQLPGLREFTPNPERFLIVWSIHYGSYTGAALGSLVALRTILRKRSKIRNSMNEAA